MAGGWTQTPNFIMDAIPDMKPAEVQVVMAIVRQTIGWQRERISLTMGELEALTKMARASVVAGVKDALKRGVISRDEDGKSYIYRITEPSTESPSVQNLNRCDEIPVQNLDRDDERPVQNLNSKTAESVQNSDRQPVQNLNCNKRNINTNTPEEERGESALPRVPTPPPKSHAHFDPRKFLANGKIPVGTGATPAEIYFEVYSVKDDRAVLNPVALQEISQNVADLALWREVVNAWALAGNKPTNISGQLDWYRDPERIRSKRNGNHSTGTRTDYQPPPRADFTQEQWRGFLADPAREPSPF